MIDILVPVLARPQNVQPLVDSIAAATSVPYHVLFLCSPGDEQEIDAVKETSWEYLLMPFAPTRSDYPRKMNVGFRRTSAEFVFLGADDLHFEPGWAEKALAQERAVVGTNDRANGQVMRGEFGTHCLVSRRYVTEEGASMDGPGFLIHEGYDHNYSDRELCSVARMRGQWGFARHAVVRHRHPSWRTAPMDSTYHKGLSTFSEDRQVFLSRAHLWNYEGLDAHERRAALELRYTASA